MPKTDDKQYCVVDHANKQGDRERRPSRRRVFERMRPGADSSADPNVTKEKRINKE